MRSLKTNSSGQLKSYFSLGSVLKKSVYLS